MGATIDVLLNNLQSNLREDFNELVEFLNEHQTDFKDCLKDVYVHELDRKLLQLSRSVIMMSGLVDPETDKSDIEGKDIGAFKRLEHTCLNRD